MTITNSSRNTDTNVDTNVAVTRRFVERFNARDFAALQEILADDVVDHHLPPGLPDGRPGVELWVRLLASALGIRVTIDDIVAHGDRVAMRCTVTGKHIGAFNGIPPTDREFTVAMQSMERIEHGRIAERWESIDNASVLQQLGVI